MSERAGLEPGEFSEVPGLLTTIPHSLLEAPRHSCLGEYPHMGKHLRWTLNEQWGFLNGENGRVERKNKKDNASGTGTRAVGCLLGYSSEDLDSMHFTDNSPWVLTAPQCGGWHWCRTLQMRKERLESYFHPQITLCCRARTHTQVYPNVQKSLNHIAPPSLINEKNRTLEFYLHTVFSRTYVCMMIPIYECMWESQIKGFEQKDPR